MQIGLSMKHMEIVLSLHFQTGTLEPLHSLSARSCSRSSVLLHKNQCSDITVCLSLITAVIVLFSPLFFKGKDRGILCFICIADSEWVTIWSEIACVSLFDLHLRLTFRSSKLSHVWQTSVRDTLNIQGSLIIVSKKQRSRG